MMSDKAKSPNTQFDQYPRTLQANMFTLYRYILLLMCFEAIAGKPFRLGYNYHPDINGWLKFHIVPLTWQNARRQCFMEGAVLASPIDEKMKSALNLEMSNSASECGIFIGANSIFSKGYFQSLEGVPLEDMPLQWLPGEPDNADDNEDCIAYVANGSVADVNCTEVLPFVCFMKKRADTRLRPCGTTDIAYEYSTKTRSCYKIHHTPRTWAEAFRVCSAEEAYLAIINSREEVSFLKDLFGLNFPKAKPNHILFIGFHDWDRRGVWRTVHEQTLASFVDWEKGQPDNASPGQYCGAMYKNGKVDDYWCERTANFICEKDPDRLTAADN